MRRVPEVLDCWFESGAMPYASEHYPFADAERFRASFPGDFIVEYVGQTRGWFYTMLVLSTALFDEPPFQHAVCHGVLLGHDRRKMSKRLRNYTDPTELVDEHGSDALRGALLMSGALSGSDIVFAAASARDVVRRLHLPLWNALHLVTAYAAVDGYTPDDTPVTYARLDRALLAEAETLRVTLEQAMEAYDFTAAYAALEGFVTTLSTWYLRTMKASLWQHGLDARKRATYSALVASLRQFAVVAAPFLPFLAEAMHEALGGEHSVHLLDWPAPRADWRDDVLVAEMRQLRELVRLARRVREQHRVKHRQPLRLARVAGVAPELLVEHQELLATELNVKAVAHDPSLAGRTEVVLDYKRLGSRLRGKMKVVAEAVRAGDYREVEGCLHVAGETVHEYTRRFVAPDPALAMTSEGHVAVALDLAVDEALAREGVARELNRVLQDLRKQARLAYGDRVCVAVAGDSAVVDATLDEHGAWLREQCGATAVVRAPLPNALAAAIVEVAGAELAVAVGGPEPA